MCIICTYAYWGNCVRCLLGVYCLLIMDIKIPQTKREAYAQLDEMLSEEDKRAIMEGDPFEFHFSLGMWIRNNWIYEQKEADVKHLAELFSKYPDFLIPDDLSSDIIKDYKKHLKRIKK